MLPPPFRLIGCRRLLLSAFIGLSTGQALAAPIDLGTVDIPSTGNPLPAVSAMGNLHQAYFFYFPYTAQLIAAQWGWTADAGAQPTLASGSFYRSDSVGSLLESLGSFEPSGPNGLRFSYENITSGYYAFSLTAVSGTFVQYSGQFEVNPTDPTSPPPTPVTEPNLLTDPPPVTGLSLPEPTPVAAPSVLPLLGLGTLALAAAMRRRHDTV